VLRPGEEGNRKSTGAFHPADAETDKNTNPRLVQGERRKPVKAILISIRPKWCMKIFERQKTVEIRKRAPQIEPPFKCYIYCTKATMDDKTQLLVNGDIGNGKVIGEFICDDAKEISVPRPAYRHEMDEKILRDSCLSYEELRWQAETPLS